MISRVYIKDLLSFNNIELELDKGLVVVTGASGSGKSLFMGSVLANFGLGSQEASVCEIELEDAKVKHSAQYDLGKNIFIKSIKKDRVRYFIDSQNIPKKELRDIFSDYISYISVRDKSGFESDKLIDILDSSIKKKDKEYSLLLKDYKEKFLEFKDSFRELEELKDKILKSNEKVEFLKYEISKIDSINPVANEYEELLVVKKQLSKIEKIEELASKSATIFDLEDSIYELYTLLDKDSHLLSDAFNQLRGDLDDIDTLKEELSEVDIESVLNRLEDLNYLIKRFGSVDESLEYLQQKKEELISFEKIDEDLSELENRVTTLQQLLQEMAKIMSNNRKAAAKYVEDGMYKYLKELKLQKANFVYEDKELDINGSDNISLRLNDTPMEKLSGGEFNRVRLALLTILASISGGSGIIILDEIDANVSGDESIAIANMISQLSKTFQIFAISHQPHLSSKANTHILVSRDEDSSCAFILNKRERVQEIARIIGGENYNKEALDFAQRVLDDN